MIACERARAVLERAREARTFSAVTAEVGTRHGSVWSFADGTLAFDRDQRVDAHTIFDLASLTKVVSTTTLALLLMRHSALALDTAVADLVPEWSGADRRSTTIRDLLEHCSGLPAHREYYNHRRGTDQYLAAIAAEPFAYEPRTQSIYSDLGFILLGILLERAGGAALDQQFDSWKAGLELGDPLTYRPPSEWAARTAATGYDVWRGRRLQGEVHDDNAAALGGVAAHAGLFGTAGAVGAAARWWLTALDAADAALFASRSAVTGSSRALGWDTMLPTSSCGTRMSPGAIGHTGFTGTSLWLDPARGRYYVLLTNRILASQNNDAIQHVRRDFHDAVQGDWP